MIEYKIIKHCKCCRKRYVVNRGMFRKYLCDSCESAAKKQART